MREQKLERNIDTGTSTRETGLKKKVSPRKHIHDHTYRSLSPSKYFTHR